MMDKDTSAKGEAGELTLAVKSAYWRGVADCCSDEHSDENAVIVAQELIQAARRPSAEPAKWAIDLVHLLRDDDSVSNLDASFKIMVFVESRARELEAPMRVRVVDLEAELARMVAALASCSETAAERYTLWQQSQAELAALKAGGEVREHLAIEAHCRLALEDIANMKSVIKDGRLCDFTLEDAQALARDRLSAQPAPGAEPGALRTEVEELLDLFVRDKDEQELFNSLPLMRTSIRWEIVKRLRARAAFGKEGA